MLVHSTGWRSIFWINVPICVAAVVLAALYVPESRAPRARRIDPVGQVLVILLLGGLTYGIIEGPGAGWGSARIAGCFVLAAAALTAIAWYERRRAEPLIDLRFFASVPFSGAVLIAIIGFAALAGFLFLNSIYLQEVRGLSPLEAGLLTLPMAAVTGVFAPLAGRVVGARGARLPLMAAGTGIAVSGVLLARMTNDTPISLLMVAYVVFGIGFGMLNAPITNTAMSGMPRSQAGVAAATASTSRQIGAALGVAVLGSVVTSRIAGPLTTGFAPASHLGWWIMSCCGVAVCALGILTTGRRARRTADRVAAQFDAGQPRIRLSTS
jgi:MFS family permease